MKRKTTYALCAALWIPALVTTPAFAQMNSQIQAQQSDNRIDKLEIAQQNGKMYLRIQMQTPLSSVPANFSIANPARIAIDFPNTSNNLGRIKEVVNQGDLQNINIVQSQGKTRLVLNLVSLPVYDVELDGKHVVNLDC